MKLKSGILLALSALFLSGCGIRALPQAKNRVDATLAEVTNQYKRRADLIPNLVNVVKGYASHEQETLTAVVEARAKATATNINPENAEQIAEFQAAQGSLSQALSRLMVVVERYPNLKADQRFQELQAQLEGTENRITVARNRHIEAIEQFNNLVTVPPESWINGLFYNFDKLAQWSVEESERSAIEQAPEVTF